MKNTRKFAAFVASFLAVACMAAPMATSFSADAEGSIEIVNSAKSHTYEAYQIFDCPHQLQSFVFDGGHEAAPELVIPWFRDRYK